MNPLILVNRQYAYPPEGGVPDLVPVPEGNSPVFLEREAAGALSRLMAALNGWQWIAPVSGWRSQAEQERIYQTSLSENGPAFTAQFVALPGHSEHQTGLAIDLGFRRPDIDFLCPDFPYAGICQTFRLRAPQYGFIERYPAGKEAITGIAHEPWHFRYVGVAHATAMARLGLTLEEYLT